MGRHGHDPLLGAGGGPEEPDEPEEPEEPEDPDVPEEPLDELPEDPDEVLGAALVTVPPAAGVMVVATAART
jgi:hypothetical protein